MEESSGNAYSLKFPVHHKNRRDESSTHTHIQNISLITIEDIDKIIIKAYHRAEAIMDCLKLTKILKKNKLNDVDKLSSFVFHQLNKKSTVDYSVINNYDVYDSLDDDDNESCEIHLTEFNEDSSNEDEEEGHHHLTTSIQTFQGMKIYEKINSAKMASYFQIFTNNKFYYRHKQTAARLLTVNKNRLSSDRVLRVKQTGKQQ